MAPTEKALATEDAFPPLAMGTLRLYSMRLCPFAQRARLILTYKKVPYETVNVNLKDKPEWLLKRNPNGTVPVLEKDDVVIYESLIVADYLNTVYPDPAGSPRLTPADPYRKARDAMLIDHYGNKFISNFFKLLLSGGKDEEALKVLTSALQRMEDELTSRKSTFFGGENLAYVDFMLWPWMERYPVLGELNIDVTLSSFPKVAKWREAMLTQPAVKECLFDCDTHFKFYQLLGAQDRTAYDIGLP